MYRYIFSFTWKLITSLLQKLAILNIWNVKHKDDGMDQNNSNVVMMDAWLQMSKFKYIKHAAVILRLYHVTSFSKAYQNLLFVAGFS